MPRKKIGEDSGDAMRETMALRLHESLKQKIEQRAKRERRKPGEFVRLLLERELERPDSASA